MLPRTTISALGSIAGAYWYDLCSIAVVMAAEKKNKIITHFVDGSLLRGTTLDFDPMKEKFHLADESGKVLSVELASLKAIFFVKELTGNVDYSERKGFFSRASSGKKIMVEFFDGELLFGHTLSYTTKGFGFFVFPGDPDCNNTKVFVVHNATKRVKIQPLPGSYAVRTYPR